MKQDIEKIVAPQPRPVEKSKLMLTPPKQAEKEQSEAAATDLPTDKPGSESPEATKQAEKEQSRAAATDLSTDHTDQPGSESPEAKKEEEEEEEGECGFCLFMKGGGCKESFVDWENCVKEAEDKGEDLVEKCGQVTARLKQCMDAHSEYYEPILRAEKHAEEQVTIELEKEEKEKQDSASNNNQQEEVAASHSDQK